MTDDNEISPEPDHDEVLDKLDALLSKHQGKPAALVETAVESKAASVPVLTQVFDATLEQTIPPVTGDIPTLTEVVFLPTASQPEATPPLRQIVDAALKETGIELDSTAQAALVQALERHLQGSLAASDPNRAENYNAGTDADFLQSASQPAVTPVPAPSSIMTDFPAAADSNPISMDLAKSFDPQPIENHWYSIWDSAGYFKPIADEGVTATASAYCIMLPPPNVTGTLHMGHAFQHTLMDALSRYHRMLGDNTLWQPGTDHAGIATQIVVERQLDQQNINRRDLGREEFLKRVWQWKEESGSTITRQMRRLGASCDW